ncbi:Calx-beta domain-containing protein [Gimesia sp.]|uniref:Calx-beta domain-containing protein n=1 Tax=Gimesia sp. TaxID=2024833 RepID=UPI003A953F31
MLLTYWLRSFLSYLRPSHHPAHKRRLRSHYGTQAVLNHQRRPVTVEELEDRTLLTSVFNINDVVVVEGDAGTTSALFTVTRSGTNAGDLNSNASIQYVTSKYSASNQDGDYSNLSGTLTFAADPTALSQTETITILVNGDSSLELDEFFTVRLHGNSTGTTIEDNIGVATILNDDFQDLVEIQSTAPPAPLSDGDHFGNEISVDGNYMVVGVIDSDLAGTDAGAAYIYFRNTHNTAGEFDDTWEYVATLTAFDAAAGDQFGSSVAIDGDTIVIGAYADDDLGDESGSVYVFRQNGSNWDFEQKLTASDGNAGDQFGGAVTIDNNTIIVGSTFHELDGPGNIPDSGAAYAFTRSGTNWSESQMITASNGALSDQFGWSVAIQSNYIFISGLKSDTNESSNDAGAVYVFKNIDGTWVEQQILGPPDGATNDLFGYDLDVYGNQLGVISTGTVAYKGAAYIFKNNSGYWEFQQKIIHTGDEANDQSAFSIKLSTELMVIGSILDDGNASDSGTATLYRLLGDSWIESKTFFSEDGTPQDQFGYDVSISGTHVIASAPLSDATSSDAGSFHVFNSNNEAFSINVLRKAEGDSGETIFTFEVTRKGEGQGDLNFNSSVSFTTIDGTATVADGDYQAQSGIVTFDASPTALSQTKTISIVVYSDTIYEGPGFETFEVLLSNPSNGATLIVPKATGYIINDDNPENDLPILTVNDVSVYEDEGAAVVNFVLDRILSEDLEIHFNIEGGSARRNVDFFDINPIVIIPAGQTSASISFPITVDNVVEADESFTISVDRSSSIRTYTSDPVKVTILNDDQATVSISDATVNESEGTVTLEIIWSAPVDAPFDLDYTTVNNSAFNSEDFQSTSGIIDNLGYTPTPYYLTIPVLNDNVREHEESFYVNLSHIQFYEYRNVIFGDSQALVTIIDDDGPAISVEDITVNEDADFATVTITLNKASADQVTVDYSTANQTAAQTDDYTPASGTLTFAPGETSKTISISIIDSVFSEETETLQVNLSNLVSDDPFVFLRKAQGEVTILDDDYFFLSIDTQNVNEADGTAVLTVSLEQAAPTAISMNYWTHFYSAREGTDFESTTGILTFNPGETIKTISVPLIDDYIPENQEKFYVRISDVQGNGSNVTITEDTGYIFINDEDQYYLTIDDLSVNETDGVALLTVTLDHALPTELTVNYTSLDQTAIAGSDYESVSGTLTFAPGELTKTISVSLIDGNSVEVLETFLIGLSNPVTTGGEVSFIQSQAQISIIDDEFASISINDVSVDEELGTAVLTVSINHPVDTTLNVGFATAEQSATEGQDFQYQSGTLIFEPGETSKELHINFTNDDIVEFSETFLVNLSLNNQVSSPNIQLVDSQAEITILNDDQCIITIHDVTVDEREGSAKVRVSISNRISSTISFDCTTIDQTASSPEDYTSITQTRTITSNTTGLYIIIPVIDDTIFEDPERLLLQISNFQTNGANVILANDQAVITIYDSMDTQIQIQDFTVDENAEEALVNITLTAPIDGTVSIDYTTVDGTARDTSDYLARSGSLVFLAGETTKTVSIPLVYSPTVELNKYFRFQISNFLINGINTPISDNESEIEIRDRDSARINLPQDFSVQESDGSVTVTVTMNRPASTAVQFNYFLVQGSADESEDYTDVSGTLIFNPGEQSKSFTIPILEDELIEADETFRVILNRLETSDTNINLDNFACNITIVDNDVGTLSIDDLTVREEDGNFYVNLSLTKALGTNLYVFYELVDVTATQPEDYAPRSDRVELIAGYLSRSFSFILKEDAIQEDTETFQINLLSITYSDMYGLTLGDSSATITILDDDHPLISVQDIYVDEDAGEAVVTVSSSLPPTSAFSVDFATSSDTALVNADYLVHSGTLIFEVGEQTKTISIPIVNSSQVEADEKFLINLSNLQAGESNAELFDDQAIVTIKDDDPVHVRISDVTVDETADTATVYVTLDQPVDVEVSMRYSSSQSSAINNEDFIGEAENFTFQPGEQEYSITFSIVDTDIVEIDEYFLVRLLNPQAGGADIILSDSVGYVHIHDDDQAQLSIEDLTVNEDIGVASIVVSLDHPVDTAITVNYSTVEQSASSDNDYIAPQSGTFTIDPGELTQTIMIPVVNSDLLEQTESFLVQLNSIQASGRNVVFANEQAEVTILDDDQSNISISDISVDEDAGTALLTVELSKPVETAVSVDFFTAENSAFDQQDFTALSGTLTFNSGEQSKTIIIPIIDSDTVEVNESFQVILSNIQSGNFDVILAVNQAEVTIIDDDQAMVTINNISVDEAAGTATLTVSLDHPVTQSISLDYQTADDTATSPADFISQSGTLTFAPSEIEKSITISIVDSNLLETEERLLVNLSNLQAGTANVSFTNIHGVITIFDDDHSNLRISDLTVQEDTGITYVTVSLDKPLVTPVSIDFSTAGQSATQSADFEQLSGTLTFAPGELTKFIPIVITDDEFVEMTETLLINLSNLQTTSPFVTLLDSQAVLTIENDDITKVAVNNIAVNEASGSALIQITLDHPVSSTITLDYTTADDTASNASDYFGKSGTLTFLAGQQTKYVSIPILNDNLVEGNESFLFNLTNLQANGFDVDFLNEQAQITIQDNDQASISVSDISVDEDAGTAFVTVTLNQPVYTEVSVDYSTSEQSALGTLDFISTSGTLSFDPGEQSKTIAISLVNTDLVESDETFLINLFNIQANEANLSLADAQAIVTILDDDQAHISIEDISVVESAGTAVITVSLDATVDTAVSVDFSTSDQTAIHPDDYHAVSGTLLFNPGELSQTITVAIVDSDNFEINETFQIDLLNIHTSARSVTLADNQAVITIQDKVTAEANLQFRVVNQPTVNSSTGESETLPENQNIISEWSTYWVEIWVDFTSHFDQGVFSVNADFNYNTAYASAAEFVFGEGFTQNRAGSIDDLTGSVTGLHAETTTNGLGADNPILFARIRFSPGPDDQVTLQTEPESIGPYNLNFELTNTQVELAGNTPVTVNADLSPGSLIYANPFDLNDDDIINYRDLILIVGLYNSVPSESESRYAWFSDYNQDDLINYRDLISLVGNYGKSKENQSPVNYPQTYPTAWTNLLLVDTFSTPPVTADSISQSSVVSTFDTVIEQTRTSPALSIEQQQTLKQIDIQVIDLGADILGTAAGSTIYIDVDAAGYGWFIDSTPAGNSEYTWSSELTLIALPDSDAAGGIDLWTVIQHELGHLLGYEHSESGLMQETLAPGIRLLPEWEWNFEYETPLEPEAVDPHFSKMQDETNLLPF